MGCGVLMKSTVFFFLSASLWHVKSSCYLGFQLWVVSCLVKNRKVIIQVVKAASIKKVYPIIKTYRIITKNKDGGVRVVSLAPKTSVGIL